MPPPTEAERRRPLTEEQHERLRAALFPEAARVTSSVLLGGIVTATYALLAHGPDGPAGEAVIRCYRGDWSPDGAAARVRSESFTLGAVAPLVALAPRVLLADPEGDVIGEPLLALSRLPGATLPPPTDARRGRWIERFAAGLASVHAADVGRLPPAFRREGAGRAVFERIEQKARDDVLSRDLVSALRAAVERLDVKTSVLVHEDYWFGNTLWRNGELTGIVDWGGARIGDARQDIAYTRADCALFLDIDASDEFLRAYEAQAGPAGDLVFWDLLNALVAHRWLDEWLVGYRDLGVHFSVEEAHRRIALFAERALARSGSTGT